MGVMDTLRHVEEAGKKAAHLGANLVRTGIQNAEDTIRHQVSTPRSVAKARFTVSNHPDSEQQRNPASTKVRTGIVSINGQDVGEMHCTGR
jgi:hypothetical protein